MVCVLSWFRLFQSTHWNVLLGAGYDQVDVDACTKHGVRVSNVPTAVDDATADTNMVGYLSKWIVRLLIVQFLILGALRGFNSCMYLCCNLLRQN